MADLNQKNKTDKTKKKACRQAGCDDELQLNEKSKTKDALRAAGVFTNEMKLITG